MKTIYKLGIFFLVIAFTACQNDMDNINNPNEELAESNEIVIIDGVIKSPQWLIQVHDSISKLRIPYPDTKIEPYYLPIYSFKYNNEEYILIWDWYNSSILDGDFYFTLSGEQIDKGSDLFLTLMHDDKKERTCLWWSGMDVSGKGVITKAWTPTSVYTPNGSLVNDTHIRTEELTQIDIAEYLADVAARFPQATILSPPTTTYNCHAYAWHMTQGGSAVWMGKTTNPTSIYRTDGSYIGTTSNNTSKVSYQSDNHSAVKTGSDMFISKWGSGALVRHHKNQSPYNASQLSYYRRFNPPPYYIGNTYDNDSGSSTVSANGSGFIGTSLNAYTAPTTQTQPTSYVWSANFGSIRGYLYPNGSLVNINMYLDSGSGGSVRLECAMYRGSTLLSTGFYYLQVTP